MMKRILIFCLAVMTFQACTDGLTDLNNDPKAPTEVSSGSLVANAQVALFDFLASTNVNTNNFRLWAQQWAQTTYADESNFILNERNVNGRTFNTLYSTVLRDLREAEPRIDADQFLSDDNKRNQKAIVEVLKIYTYTIAVDIFGDMPYSEAFPSDPNDVVLAYDDDAAIYADLMTRLSAAINSLNGDSAMGASDLVYGGDVASWAKFANSLKLRMAIRMADVNESAARTAANEAVAAGVFESSADDATLVYTGSTPNTNPLWVDLVQSGRSDFIASATIVDTMNTLNDPRRPYYFRDTYDGAYVGGASGDNNAYNTNSHPGAALLDPTFPHSILSFTEVQFLLADAAERGFTAGGDAADFYAAGVTSSVVEWGGSETDAAAYLTQPLVDYATAPGTWKEKIALQKWLALYNRGFEAWTTYRLYDAPEMRVAVQAGTLPPNRYTYPVSEYSLNEVSVSAAASAMGGDDLFSKVFWDAN